MGLEVLSKETLEYANRRIDKAITMGLPHLIFRRVGSEKMYMNANPPQARIMSKKFSPNFLVRDEFAPDGIYNKHIMYTRGTTPVKVGNVIQYEPKAERFDSNDDGFIYAPVDDRLLCTLLLLDDRNEDYKYRNKNVNAEWYEVKERNKISTNTDLVREKTEHALIGIVFAMDMEELTAYAFEVKEKGGKVSVNGKSKGDLAKELITVIKTDPLLFGQCIPSAKSKASVLVTQGVDLDIIATTKGNNWNFTKHNLKEEGGFAPFSITSNENNKIVKLVEFLSDGKDANGERIREKLHGLLFPSDNEDWAFLETKKEEEVTA